MADANELRRAYVDDIAVVSRAFQDDVYEYEKLTVRSFRDTFRTLARLNVGALAVWSAVVALSMANIAQQRTLLLASLACFVGALALTYLARALTHVVVARHAEAERHFEHEQVLRIGAAHYPTLVDTTYATKEADHSRARAIGKIERSNAYRLCAIATLWVSVVASLLGCYLALRAGLSSVLRIAL